MWLILFYVPTVLFLIYVLLDISWRLWKRKHSFLPNAPNIPWLGAAYYLRSSRSFYEALTAFAPRYNHLYIIWFGPIPAIRAGTVEYVEAVLRSHETLTKSLLYDPLLEWLRRGLLMSTGKKWKARRTALTGAFHFTILNDFMDIFKERASALVEKINENVDSDKEIDIQHLSSLSTLDVMCESSMGVKINALHSADSEYVQAVHNIKILILLRALNPFLKSRFVYELTSNGKEFYRNLNTLHNFTIDVINKNIAERKLMKDKMKFETVGQDPVTDNFNRKKMVFLDLLIDLYEKGEIDIDGIREEVDTFMFEGHDTTSAGLNWSLYEIGRRPDVQEKLHEEIDLVSSSDLSITEKIRQLKYLDIVIKECLRFHPPVPMFGRTLEKDLKVGSDTVPAGTQIIVESFSVHMNEAYWDEPAVFKPERFVSETFSKRNPYCYVPFSAGPRNCIGQKFAMLELKVFLFFVLSAFRIKSVQTPAELETCYDVITYSANGIKLLFSSR